MRAVESDRNEPGTGAEIARWSGVPIMAFCGGNDQNEPGGIGGCRLWVVDGKEKTQIEPEKLDFDVKIAGWSGEEVSEENVQNEPKVKVGRKLPVVSRQLPMGNEQRPSMEPQRTQRAQRENHAWKSEDRDSPEILFALSAGFAVQLTRQS